MSIRNYRKQYVEKAAADCRRDVLNVDKFNKDEQLDIVRTYIRLVSDVLDVRYDTAADMIQMALAKQR